MTYATRLSVRKSLQEKKEMNNKSDGKGRSNNQQQKNFSPLPPQKPQYVKVYISSILAVKIENGQEYVLLAYSDPNLVSDWQPMRNLRNAKDLIEDFRKRIQTQVESKNSLIFNSDQMITHEEHHSDCTESSVTTPDTISNVSESSKSSVAGDDIEQRKFQ